MVHSTKNLLTFGAACTAIALSLLMAPSQALAGNTVSMGKGVKCYWVLVSSNPATGSNVYTQVCRKSGV